MLTFYGAGQKGAVRVDTSTAHLPATVTWIDALDPDADEIAFLEGALGKPVPRLADLEEIETSSRLSVEGDTIVMSIPATVRDTAGVPGATPIGFMMSKDHVVTIRFTRLPSFETLGDHVAAQGALPADGLSATVLILETIVDHLADILERIGGDLDGISRRIFGPDVLSAKTRGPRNTGDRLHDLLRTVGRSGDLASRVSQTLLGLNRMVPYILSHASSYMTPDNKARLDTVAQDAKSLNDYEDHLTGKTQFLLDTLLGIANIEQNNVFRVLTVVSVVGIPPTFFASLWGMNFKSMPELDWPHGYVMGLSVIAISAVLPAVWFKVKGWW